MAGRGAQVVVTLIVTVFFTACAQHRDLVPSTLSDPPPRLFGAFVYRGVWSGMAPVEALERSLDFQLDIVHWFMCWDTDWDERLVVMAAQQGRRPLISWEPHRQPVTAIAAGDYDDYLRSWARGAAAYGEVIFLRPFPEMNGDWTPWNGNAPALVAAWQRMVTIFAKRGQITSSGSGHPISPTSRARRKTAWSATTPARPMSISWRSPATTGARLAPGATGALLRRSLLRPLSASLSLAHSRCGSLR